MFSAALLSGSLGCAHSANCRTVPPFGAIVPQLGASTPLTLDLVAVTSLADIERTLGSAAEPNQYRQLTAFQCQCLAAAASPRGNLLAQQSEAGVSARYSGHRHDRGASVLRELMAIRAVEERNDSAAKALELYYRLAEAEYNRGVLQRSFAEIDGAIANYHQVHKQGLRLPVDEGTLQRQRLELCDRQAQTHGAITQLNGQLCVLLGLEADPGLPLWPAADLRVEATKVDAGEAVAAGLATRPDLQMLKLLSMTLDRHTLPAIRAGLQHVDPGLGQTAAGRSLLPSLNGGNLAAELPTRREQLQQASTDYVRQAEQQIRQAVGGLETQLRQVAVAKERLESWQQRVAALRERRGYDQTTAFDISAAQLELLRAECDLIRQVIAWKLAGVALQHAQGTLATECGYALPDCCCRP